MISSNDNMGPRVDLGGETPPQSPAAGNRGASAPRVPSMPTPPAKSGPGALGLVSLLLSLLALAVALWSLLSQPEMIPPPPVSPSVVPGATAERVAKMEKDVQDLMLRMVTLDKELRAVASKAGSVTKLSQLSNRVAALQDRLDAMAVEKKISSLEKKAQVKASPRQKPSASEKAKSKEPEKKADKKKAPQRSKQTYTVRRGDTLFTVAQRYKVTMRDLKQWNNLKGNMLMVGQKLVIYK